MPAPLTVGFDLDMTLFDTRPGVRKVWEALSASTGLTVDIDLVVSRLGPPLETELANWVTPDQTDEFVGHYRRLYRHHAIEPAIVMPGAREALAEIHRRAGRTMVVTAKNTADAQRHLDHADLPVDIVVGNLWGEGKASALRRHGAQIYVGDHVLDIAGAHAADATAVGVASGPCSATDLWEAGADVVLADLGAFPAWLAQARPIGTGL